MFNSLNTSNITFKEIMLAEVNNDVSIRPSWFITPAGLDLSSWEMVEYPESGTALTENALELSKNYMVVKPSSKPAVIFTPKTELASRLWEIRKHFVASGELLLDWAGVQEEVSQRRGDRE
jgi:hypothetical protein